MNVDSEEISAQILEIGFLRDDEECTLEEKFGLSAAPPLIAFRDLVGESPGSTRKLVATVAACRAAGGCLYQTATLIVEGNVVIGVRPS